MANLQGSSVTGDLAVTGTVDGRDVATDGTKLDGIESSADVTDTTNVTAAGALMDSELSGLAAVKATTGTFLTADQTKLDGIETSATADQTASEIKTLLENGIDSVHYVNASIDNEHIADDAINSEHYAAGSIDNEHIANDAINSEHYAAGSIDNEHLADDAVGVAELSATGTASSSTYLRGDNAWAEVAGGTSWQSVTTGTTLTAAAGNGYPIDTSANACTITLPGSASVGDSIEFVDYANTWGLNNITLNTNGLKFQGLNSTFIFGMGVWSFTIIYVDTAKGWMPVYPYKGLSQQNSEGIFGFGTPTSSVGQTSHKISTAGTIAAEVTHVGTSRTILAATEYGGDKGIFGFGYISAKTSITNHVSTTGVIASDNAGVGMNRTYLTACSFGGDCGIFMGGWGDSPYSSPRDQANIVGNEGIVRTDTSGVGTARSEPSATEYGGDKGILYAGNNDVINLNTSQLIDNTGVLSADVSGVGTARDWACGVAYGSDRGLFCFGDQDGGANYYNLVSNLGVIQSDQSTAATDRHSMAGTQYGIDKAIVVQGYSSGYFQASNTISNTGTISADISNSQAQRRRHAACSFN